MTVHIIPAESQAAILEMLERQGMLVGRQGVMTQSKTETVPSVFTEQESMIVEDIHSMLLGIDESVTRLKSGKTVLSRLKGPSTESATGIAKTNPVAGYSNRLASELVRQHQLHAMASYEKHAKSEIKRLSGLNIPMLCFGIDALQQLPCESITLASSATILGKICAVLKFLSIHHNTDVLEYSLYPAGSESYIVRRADSLRLDLFLDSGPISRYFRMQKFDSAVEALVECVHEIGSSLFRRQLDISQSDNTHSASTSRTLAVGFEHSFNLHKCTVGGLPYALGLSDSESQWGTSVKYLIDNIKSMLVCSHTMRPV